MGQQGYMSVKFPEGDILPSPLFLLRIITIFCWDILCILRLIKLNRKFGIILLCLQVGTILVEYKLLYFNFESWTSTLRSSTCGFIWARNTNRLEL